MVSVAVMIESDFCNYGGCWPMKEENCTKLRPKVEYQDTSRLDCCVSLVPLMWQLQKELLPHIEPECLSFTIMLVFLNFQCFAHIVEKLTSKCVTTKT